jgi:hypothetical protein
MLEDEESASQGLLYTGGKPKEKGPSERALRPSLSLNLLVLRRLFTRLLTSAPTAASAPQQWSTRAHQRSSHFAPSPAFAVGQAPAGVPAWLSFRLRE